MDLSINIIVDLVVAAILVIGIVTGAKKGFVKTIAGFLIVVLSIFGARILSSLVTDPITSFVFPMVEEKISEKIGNNIIDPSGIEIVDRAVEEASGGVTSILTVTTEAFVRSIVHAIAFLLCFIIVSLILRLLVDVVDKVFDLPLLKSVNGLLGAVFGLLQVVIILFLVPYLARQLGIGLFDRMSEGTLLLSFFVNNSIFDLIHLFLS